ncbi:gephyrin-like molybdotransferase Glp [Candidatus Hydrogenedentota bacterium]
MAMIPFEDAFQTTIGSKRLLGSERVSIEDAPGRILAEDVVSDMDMPPFDKSAMDGYACRREDLSEELSIVETIPAGACPEKTLGPKECSKIMTGAMAPDGANCVIMVEYSENPTPKMVRFTGEKTKDNICRKGEDIKKGDVVLSKGAWLRSQHVAVLAMVGCANPLVSCQPSVGIIATGDELVEPHVAPGLSQIRNSNSYQLCAQVTAAGAAPTYYGIAGDSADVLRATVEKAMAENDVVLLSGGVSMGDFDLVPGILRECGFDLKFEQVAVKPGKPTVFGVSDTSFCFGLPGNPVSTFAIFEILVKPFLYSMMGHDYKPAEIHMPLENTITSTKIERESWVPVCLTETGRVVQIEYHGSAHVNALCLADGLVKIPRGVSELKKGTLVYVRQI